MSSRISVTSVMALFALAFPVTALAQITSASGSIIGSDGSIRAIQPTVTTNPVTNNGNNNPVSNTPSVTGTVTANQNGGLSATGSILTGGTAIPITGTPSAGTIGSAAGGTQGSSIGNAVGSIVGGEGSPIGTVVGVIAGAAGATGPGQTFVLPTVGNVRSIGAGTLINSQGIITRSGSIVARISPNGLVNSAGGLLSNALNNELSSLLGSTAVRFTRAQNVNFRQANTYVAATANGGFTYAGFGNNLAGSLLGLFTQLIR